LADISKITVNNTQYNIKDTTARTGNIETSRLVRPAKLNGVADNTIIPQVDDLRANRLAFLPADQIIIEKTTDGGTTWVDAGVSDATKLGLFSQTRAGVYIPLLNGVKDIRCGLRVTITAMKYDVPSGTAETQKYNYWNSTYVKTTERYNQLREMYFWVSSNSDAIKLTVQRATGGSPNNWVTIFDRSDYGMTGWSSNDYVSFSQNTFGGGTNQTGNYWNYRMIFMTCGANGSSTLSGTNTTSAQAIQEIRGYGTTWWTAGNKFAASDHMYSWDANQNVTFPAQVTATNFAGTLNGKTLGVSVPADAKFTDTTYVFDGTYDASTNKAATVSTVTTAVSAKADKTDTVLETSLSRGRKASTTVGTGSFAFGNDVTASGMYSLATGYNTAAVGSYAHAEGGGTTARVYSHAEGYITTANGDCSHSEGQYTIAQRKSQHASGEFNVADVTGTVSTRGTYVEIVGNGTSTSMRSNARALDWDGNEYLMGDLYVGCDEDSTGGTKIDMSVKADKADTVLTTTLSRGRKDNTTVGTGSFAFGYEVTASGNYSCAEGVNTTASGYGSRAEGANTTSSGNYSHAEGSETTASGACAHVEGYQSTASGGYSHAEGDQTTASGLYSHSEGYGTTAQRRFQHVYGKYNVLDTTGSTTSDDGNYVEIVGNGASSSARSNARTLDWSGNERLKGDLYVGCNANGTGGTKVITSAFTGATSSASGAIGLVPAPSTGDNEKYLKGDGTWGTVSGGGASLLTPSTAFAIPSSGDSITYNMSGITSTCELIRWNFSDSAENSPPVTLQWETGNGYFTITNVSGDTNESMKPVFAETVATPITQQHKEMK